MKTMGLSGGSKIVWRLLFAGTLMFVLLAGVPAQRLTWLRTAIEDSSASAHDEVGNLYVAANPGVPILRKLDVNGNLVWTAPVTFPVRQVIARQGRVVISGDNGLDPVKPGATIADINPANGVTRWTWSEASRTVLNGARLATGGNVFFAFTDFSGGVNAKFIDPTGNASSVISIVPVSIYGDTSIDVDAAGNGIVSTSDSFYDGVTDFTYFDWSIQSWSPNGTKNWQTFDSDQVGGDTGGYFSSQVLCDNTTNRLYFPSSVGTRRYALSTGNHLSSALSGEFHLLADGSYVVTKYLDNNYKSLARYDGADALISTTRVPISLQFSLLELQPDGKVAGAGFDNQFSPAVGLIGEIRAGGGLDWFFRANDDTVYFNTFARIAPSSYVFSGSTQGFYFPYSHWIAAGIVGGSLTLSAPSVWGGQTVMGTITLPSPAPFGGLRYRVEGMYSGGVFFTDFVTINQGAVTATFPITTAPSSTQQLAHISAKLGTGELPADLSVDGASIVSLVLSPPSVYGGAIVGGRVTLSKTVPVDTPVFLNVDGSGFAEDVTVKAGTQSVGTPVTTFPVYQDQILTLTASTNSGSIKTFALTVLAPRVQTFSLSANMVTGGESLVGTVKLNSALPTDGLDLALSSTGAIVPFSVPLHMDSTTKTFTINTLPVGANAPASVTVTLNGVSTTRNLTVLAPSVSSLTISPATVYGGTSTVGVLKLNGKAPAAGTAVALASNSPSAVVPSVVTVAAGYLTGSFTITTSARATDANVTVMATANGVSKTATFLIRKVALVSMVLSPTTVQGGHTTVMILKLTSPAPVGGTVVSLTSGAPIYVQVPATVTIAAGTSAKSLTVTTNPVPATKQVLLKAGYDGKTVQAYLTVTP